MQIAKVQTTIGQITFKHITATRFVVRCRGLSAFKLKQIKDGTWEGVPVKGDKTWVAVGKTAEACYKNSVKTFW